MKVLALGKVSKHLLLAIPEGASEAQMNILNDVTDYANEHRINIITKIIK
jgi:hypothetical protein